MSNNWQSMGAAELGRGIDAGEIDPVTLAEHFLDAIDAHDLGPLIYARTMRTRTLAEAQAAAARARSGLRFGPLDGVPVSWKDLFDTAAVATEAGSALLAGRTPAQDAEVLRRATLRGSVCLGKTHMSELAFSGLGLNPITATPPCINDAGAVPGGSSSGAAASVAHGLAPMAMGSDTGGSVRIPAAWNDLVGLKTTPGLLPLTGVVPLAAKFDTIGPLARNVEDAALGFAMMAGIKAPDLRECSLNGVRLLSLRTVAQDDLRDAPRAAYENAVMRLETAGAHVSHAEIPQVADAMDLTGVLYATEAYGTWKDVIEDAPDKMFPEILARFRGGAQYSGPDYVAAWLALDRLRREYLAATARYDAVILPTAPNLPPNKARLETDSDYYVTENLLTLRNTRIGNLMGLAGLTLPTGVPSTGIMFLTPPNSEARLLRLGAAAEAALA
ncbi:amidase [Actibacterium mucosum KCTC 23349]|uniref:Amidase n=1 Tax=Actibacterium mucosum KCTC 23349 TaxID=1454373 RepID=A0A037ZM29_9RHOB|nr:amidase family protein [Actibacterium mucosum]KAJ57476.1 amidase [Actibacterium mucosum KCTC 23349]